MFCVKCGAEEDLYDHLCAQCFVSEHTFAKIDDTVDVTFCTHCGAYRHHGRWFDTDTREEAIETVVLDAVSVYPTAEALAITFSHRYEDRSNIALSLDLDLEVLGLVVSKHLETKVRLKHGVCKRCSRQRGNYFEAIMQIRATKRKLSEEELLTVHRTVEEHIAKLSEDNRDLFITREELIHGGLDYYLSETSAARFVAKQLRMIFGGKITETASLIGRSDGRDVYRSTLLLRLPRLREGDFVQIEDEVYQLLGPPRQRVQTRELRSGTETHRKLETLSEGWYLGGEELVEEAVIVSESDRELQVLDPATYATRDVIKPDGYTRAGDHVRVLRVDNELLIVG